MTALNSCSTLEYGKLQKSNRSAKSDAEKAMPGKWRIRLHAIWLFTFSDLKTIVGPQTAFGILHALCADIFGVKYPRESLNIAFRAPFVVFWVWINLLPFAIDNQRRRAAIREDSVNKPWRPLPSGLVSPTESKHMMLVFYALAFVSSLMLGGMRQHIALVILGYLYNNRGGADRSSVVRNLINGMGFICFGSGAMEIALGTSLPTQPFLVAWFGLIGLVVSTTVHVQDMSDQMGDRSRGRWTIPLSIGDKASRWTIAAAMAFWISYCPRFWQLSHFQCGATTALGITVIVRTITQRSVQNDKTTFRLWNAWMVTMYLMPLLRKIISRAEK